MLTLEQISGYFPEPLRRRNPRGMLIEYLQHELLDSLFKSTDAASLSFIGFDAEQQARITTFRDYWRGKMDDLYRRPQ